MEPSSLRRYRKKLTVSPILISSARNLPTFCFPLREGRTTASIALLLVFGASSTTLTVEVLGTRTESGLPVESVPSTRISDPVFVAESTVRVVSSPVVALVPVTVSPTRRSSGSFCPLVAGVVFVTLRSALGAVFLGVRAGEGASGVGVSAFSGRGLRNCLAFFWFSMALSRCLLRSILTDADSLLRRFSRSLVA